MLQLSVIVVNWNVRDLLRACLRSVERERHPERSEGSFSSQPGRSFVAAAPQDDMLPGTEIIVVDNASSDGSVEMVRGEFPNARLIANAENAGFGAANNQALSQSEGKYVLFLNPDTELRPGAVRRLLAFIDQRPRAGCVGPRLLNPDGSTQPSRRGFPGVGTFFVESTVLQRYLGSLPALQRFYRAELPEDEPQQVDWLVGACLLMRRGALDEVGAFDERFFMYSEEMDLCYRLRRAGYEIWFVPEAEVLHHEAASSSQDLFRRNVNFHESRYRFFRKHHGLAPALALRWFVFGTFVFQLAEEAAKFLLQPAKRQLRRDRVHLYSRIVKWYLSAS
ncbi:MAG TPA: glycosyltransferase family 2 protein [Chloroflexota bacterium]|nr:glycosyltransferase family 2 protein [Chloroflexota bacterium]